MPAALTSVQRTRLRATFAILIAACLDPYAERRVLADGETAICNAQ